MKIAYIGIGSNLGDRKSNIDKAIRLVDFMKGVRVKKISSITRYKQTPINPTNTKLIYLFLILNFFILLLVLTNIL